MARGDNRASAAVSEQSGKNVQAWATDTYVAILCSDTYAASADFINRSQFTEVVGGAYAPQAVTQTFNRVGSKSTFQGTSVQWAVDAAGPQDCRVCVLVNTTNVGADDVLNVVDLTSDGTTPIDNQVNAIAVNFASSPTLEVDRV